MQLSSLVLTIVSPNLVTLLYAEVLRVSLLEYLKRDVGERGASLI